MIDYYYTLWYDFTAEPFTTLLINFIVASYRPLVSNYSIFNISVRWHRLVVVSRTDNVLATQVAFDNWSVWYSEGEKMKSENLHSALSPKDL